MVAFRVAFLLVFLGLCGEQVSAKRNTTSGSECDADGGECVSPGNCMTPNTAAEACDHGSVCCNPTGLQAFRQTLELDGFEVNLRAFAPPPCPCSANSISICNQTNYSLTFEGDCVQVHSPHYNHPYENNMNCNLQVTAPSSCEIEVHFCEVSLEKCFYDTLTVNGITYCGVMNPANFITTNNIATMQFATDFSQVNRGFKMVMTAVNCFHCSDGPVYVVGTDTVVTTSSGGLIYSPGYPGTYANNVNFIMTINAPVGSTITFDYIVFDIELGDTCQFDFFQIYDTTTAPPHPKYCGSVAPTFTVSATNQVEIVFFTDKSVVADGFEICFTVCGAMNNFMGNPNNSPSVDFHQAWGPR
ncbi:CUB domain-containing protein 2-like [Penaeus monodon]|uniref:CUB domain-containing protein 2-like n=1 Tax=Penaeus monodon TaxID=6687 RepID=UPI0018A7857A|nr:CUB domain-containing protein 2-like [Penaeus monodon]